MAWNRKMAEPGTLSIEYTPRGRWGGRLTRRELPTDDPLLNALSPRKRARLAAIWLHRAAMERRVADSFEVIHGALTRRRADAQLIGLAERAIDDEYRHAELSRFVASQFAGRELDAPPRLSLVVPKHTGASPQVRDALFIVGQCVLNETTASAFLEACLVRAEGTLARCALSELLSDEIDHGRIGWTFLASLATADRNELNRWLLPMAFVNLRQWRRETPDDPDYSAEFAHHGAPPASVIHAAVLAALQELIVPGFERLGMATAPLRRWLAAGADTECPPAD